MNSYEKVLIFVRNADSFQKREGSRSYSLA